MVGRVYEVDGVYNQRPTAKRTNPEYFVNDNETTDYRPPSTDQNSYQHHKHVR